jgi:hypothetical protein
MHALLVVEGDVVAQGLSKLLVVSEGLAVQPWVFIEWKNDSMCALFILPARFMFCNMPSLEI